uniref:hypothetical protein n=1 Tax=Enterobacter hormaechei TaxID=158836 RepID=UPI00168185D8
SIGFGFGAIWHIWWLAGLSFLGIILTWVIKSFDEDVDYYVPVPEIQKIEDQRFAEISKAGVTYGK